MGFSSDPGGGPGRSPPGAGSVTCSAWERPARGEHGAERAPPARPGRPSGLEPPGGRRASGDTFQRSINAFVDAFPRAPQDERTALVAHPIECNGPMEGLVAAVVSALCRETGTPASPWVGTEASDEPFFAFRRARSRCGSG